MRDFEALYYLHLLSSYSPFGANTILTHATPILFILLFLDISIYHIMHN